MKTVVIDRNIFIEHKSHFLDRVVRILFNKVKEGRDISTDLESLGRDIDDLEKKMRDELNGDKKETNIAENTTYRTTISRLREGLACLKR